MKPPEGLEGIRCEQCDIEGLHHFVVGTLSMSDYGVVSWNGIKCSSCQHIVIAYAENERVRDLFDQWEVDRDDLDFETAFRVESAELIFAAQKELMG
jgi:hypothetical protein